MEPSPIPAQPIPDEVPGLIRALAELPPDAQMDADYLARVFGRSRKTIQRAVRRGELPAPYVFMGRHHWLAKAILQHLQTLQDRALQDAQRREIRRDRHLPRRTLPLHPWGDEAGLPISGAQTTPGV